MHSGFAVTVMSESFKARDIGLRAQKKILGRMAANKSARKIFIDDNTASLLDNLFKMIRLYVSNQSWEVAYAERACPASLKKIKKYFINKVFIMNKLNC